jgi:uncharacterized protein
MLGHDHHTFADRIQFTGFAFAYLGERVKWNHAAAFACLVGAVGFAFWGRP